MLLLIIELYLYQMLPSFWCFRTSNGRDLESWIVQVESDNSEKFVRELSRKYDFARYGQVGALNGFYYFERTIPSNHRRKRSPLSLDNEPGVLWYERQYEKKRFKRDLLSQPNIHPLNDPSTTNGLNFSFNDTFWNNQWYLKSPNNTKKITMDVEEVWAMGYTGKNVVISVLDDGIEHNHRDLNKNYDPMASWDVNEEDPDPMPRYDMNDENKHGTRCAGVIAAEANNSFCIVGVAFDSRIGGVRMLDSKVTDRVEAEALSLNSQYIEIYSASWGPSDEGNAVEGPDKVAMQALISGVRFGRNGLGSIFIWASGNGGHNSDDCNCDGYVNSIYTFSVNSCSDSGGIPWYSESCAATIVTTPSSGDASQSRIFTTDLHGECTDKHTGTSASAPLAAGVIALVLEANRNLSWRDIQHVAIFSADPNSLSHNLGWNKNSVGLQFHSQFGFGVMNALSMVKYAIHPRWKTVGAQLSCESLLYTPEITIKPKFSSYFKLNVSNCISESKKGVKYLEHVQLRISLTHTIRGNLAIYVISPSGTKSQVLHFRKVDFSSDGFKNWTFMSVHFWAENPVGIWTIEIFDNGLYESYYDRTHQLLMCQLVFYGTNEASFYHKTWKNYKQRKRVKMNQPSKTRNNATKKLSIYNRPVPSSLTLDNSVKTMFKDVIQNIKRSAENTVSYYSEIIGSNLLRAVQKFSSLLLIE